MISKVGQIDVTLFRAIFSFRDCCPVLSPFYSLEFQAELPYLTIVRRTTDTVAVVLDFQDVRVSIHIAIHLLSLARIVQMPYIVMQQLLLRLSGASEGSAASYTRLVRHYGSRRRNDASGLGNGPKSPRPYVWTYRFLPQHRTQEPQHPRIT